MNRVDIQGEQESEEQRHQILIAADCKITLRTLSLFGTRMPRGCGFIGFVQRILQFTTDKPWEDRL